MEKGIEGQAVKNAWRADRETGNEGGESIHGAGVLSGGERHVGRAVRQSEDVLLQRVGGV